MSPEKAAQVAEARAKRDAERNLELAGPDLLNALELAEATIVRLNRFDSANGTLDVIRAAIAKAHGEPDIAAAVKLANEKALFDSLI